MTTENTDAGIRILTKTIRKLTEQLAEADHMLGIGYSSHADTMTSLDEERESRIAAERRWVEQSERVVSLDADLANMRARIDKALDALPWSPAAPVDFAPIARARRILKGEES